MEFSFDTKLKAIGFLKCNGYINRVVIGKNKRAEFLEQLYNDGLITYNLQELTKKGDNFFRDNFLRYNEITNK